MPPEELLVLITQAIVHNPESVYIRVESAERKRIVRLHVSDIDLQRMIGLRGEVVRAIETVLDAARMRRGTRYMVSVVACEGSKVLGKSCEQNAGAEGVA